MKNLNKVAVLMGALLVGSVGFATSPINFPVGTRLVFSGENINPSENLSFSYGYGCGSTSYDSYVNINASGQTFFALNPSCTSSTSVSSDFLGTASDGSQLFADINDVIPFMQKGLPTLCIQSIQNTAMVPGISYLVTFSTGSVPATGASYLTCTVSQE